MRVLVDEKVQEEAIVNTVLQVPPTNGWMIELGYKVSGSEDSFQCGYRYAGFLDL